MYITVTYRCEDCPQEARITARFQFRVKEDGKAEGKWSFEPGITEKTQDPTGILQGLLDLIQNMATKTEELPDDTGDESGG